MGEAPGEQEDELGYPFVGPAGIILNRCLKAAGLERNDVLLMNRVRCRPVRNRLQDFPEAIPNCQEWVDYEFQQYNPKVVVLLGASAARMVFGANVAIGKILGHLRFTDRLFVATYHPASALGYRSPENADHIIKHLALAKGLLNV